VVNQLDLAAFLGVDRTTVMLWVRQGLPMVRRAGPRGAHQIDLAAAVRWLRARDQADAEERLARANPDAEVARVRKLRAEARLAELDAAAREGELVPAAQVGERWARRVGAARERFLTLPAVLVSRGLVDPGREGEATALVHEALAELAAGETS
jgi:phage terminase Nu1 subunit (DNA packaging protein)